MREWKFVCGSVVQGRRSILEQRHDFGMDGPKNHQTTRDLGGVRRELVNFGLKVRAELRQSLPVEVLELIQNDDEPVSSKRSDRGG